MFSKRDLYVLCTCSVVVRKLAKIHSRQWHAIDRENTDPTRMRWRWWHTIDHQNRRPVRMRWQKWHAIDHHYMNPRRMYWRRRHTVDHHNTNLTRMHSRQRPTDIRIKQGILFASTCFVSWSTDEYPRHPSLQGYHKSQSAQRVIRQLFNRPLFLFGMVVGFVNFFFWPVL